MTHEKRPLGDRYSLVRPLGTGGMATVYLADDMRLGRQVAVKILHGHYANDPTFVARFEGEARTAAALAHPNIVQVFDVGHDDDRYFIVMEYIEGETLKELIEREGPLQVQRSLTIASHVLAALQFAHAHNLVHRDVKAQNILITPSGAVKVADFGIARAFGNRAEQTLTATGMVIGSVHYFSPEQAQGQAATPRSDVYSLGVLLFEMLTGRLPFTGENPVAVAMQQVTGTPPRPTALNPAIPLAVEAVVMQAMAKSPTERFDGAGPMKETVDTLLRNAGGSTRVARVVSPPPPPRTTVNVASSSIEPPPPRGPSSRTLWTVAIALALILLALLGALVSSGAFKGGGEIRTPTPPPSTPTTTARPTRIVVAPPATATKRPQATPTLPPTRTTIPTATPKDTAAPTALPSSTPLNPTLSPTPAATGTATPQGSPSLRLQPGTTTTGSVVTASGSGWPNGSTVSLTATFGNVPQSLTQIATTNGGFTAEFTVPTGTAPGTYHVQAQDNQGDSSVSSLIVTG